MNFDIESAVVYHRGHSSMWLVAILSVCMGTCLTQLVFANQTYTWIVVGVFVCAFAFAVVLVDRINWSSPRIVMLVMFLIYSLACLPACFFAFQEPEFSLRTVVIAVLAIGPGGLASIVGARHFARVLQYLLSKFLLVE